MPLPPVKLIVPRTRTYRHIWALKSAIAGHNGDLKMDDPAGVSDVVVVIGSRSSTR